jgi:hypothetical protein
MKIEKKNFYKKKNKMWFYFVYVALFEGNMYTLKINGPSDKKIVCEMVPNLVEQYKLCNIKLISIESYTNMADHDDSVTSYNMFLKK